MRATTTQSDSNNLSLYELVRLGHLVNEPTKCRILGESLSKSRRDRMFGKGVPFVQNGRQIRFDPRDILAHIEANRKGAA